MARKHKSNKSSNTIGLVFLGILGLALVIALLLQGNNVALLNPKGQIASNQYNLLRNSTLIMLILAIPVLSTMFYFAWRYREDNPKAVHDTGKTHSKKLFVFLWTIPFIFLVILGNGMLRANYDLDPKKPIDSTKQTITIQVVALQWKWLFIYPEQGIASLNLAEFPVDTPIKFELTADEAPMNSFWIPNLGGQIYAMTGHSTTLNLMANSLGDFPGSAAEINGEGFSRMNFTARSVSDSEFSQWVNEAKTNGQVLNWDAYEELIKPSENYKTSLYSSVEANLYAKVLIKYMAMDTESHNHETHSEDY